MLDNLTLTQTLAALIGLYFLAGGTGLLVDRNGIADLFNDLIDQPMLGYLGGVIAFAIGGAIVAVHNDWTSFLSGFVSFVGWVSLVEGVLMLACRKWFLGTIGRLALSTGFVTLFGILTLFAGLVLVGVSLIG